MKQCIYIIVAIAFYTHAIHGMDKANDTIEKKDNNYVYRRSKNKEKFQFRAPSYRIIFAENLYKIIREFPVDNYLKSLPSELLKEIAEFAAYEAYKEKYEAECQDTYSRTNILKSELVRLEALLQDNGNPETKKL